MHNGTNLISQGANILRRNKRYVIWFYLLNLFFAWLGAAAFTAHARGILDHSLYSDKLLHGFDLAVLVEMIARPEFGPIQSSVAPATLGAVLFLLSCLVFIPGAFLGFSSDHRISRQEYFRACGHNLWRFVRLFICFAILAGIITGILFGVQSALVKAVDHAANDDRLPFITDIIGMTIIFLVLTSLRIWFDLTQADVVLRDQPAVRKSMAWGFRTARQNFGRLFGTYIAIALVALVILVIGVLLWHAIVPASSVLGAFIVGQCTLFLLLSMRFWQRASAVAFYVSKSAEPVIETQSAVVAVPAISAS